MKHTIDCNPTTDSIDGLVVRHTCDNPPCVEPSHLILGTQADNVADAVERGRTCRGERRANAKLTEDDVRAIRTDKRSQRAIAAEYGVSQPTVGKVIRGEIWSHI